MRWTFIFRISPTPPLSWKLPLSSVCVSASWSSVPDNIHRQINLVGIKMCSQKLLLHKLKKNSVSLLIKISSWEKCKFEVFKLKFLLRTSSSHLVSLFFLNYKPSLFLFQSLILVLFNGALPHISRPRTPTDCWRKAAQIEARTTSANRMTTMEFRML